MLPPALTIRAIPDRHAESPGAQGGAMFESLFGAEMPLLVRFFIALVFVVVSIFAVLWAVRRFFGGGTPGAASARGRQPRLAVIDAATVDTRRRLILIRRDNVEHLLMIGGPTDVVIEPNIVRAMPARDQMPQRQGVGGAEPPPRIAPLPDA